MLDYVVKKIVAKEDERIVTDSSYDEMLKFTEEEICPDFMDPEILCIKFMLCMGEDDDEPEYTDWYINPYHYKGSGAEFASNYRMDEEFIPEILLIQVPTVYIKNKYLAFNETLLINSSTHKTDEEKLEEFWKIYGKTIKEYSNRHSN